MPISKRVARASALFFALTTISSQNGNLARADDTTASKPLPANHALIENGIADFHVSGKSAANADSTIVGITDLAGINQALRVNVRQKATSDYELQYVLPVTAELKKGDVLWLAVWARMFRTEDESGQGVLGVVMEESQGKFDKLIQRRVSITKDWQRIAVPVRLNKDYPAGTTHVSLRVGGVAQTLELAGPQLVRFDQPTEVKLADLPQTRLTYLGREPDAPWRKEAAERIEKYRKAPLTVRVVDAAGKPVKGASVTVAMTQHAFPFGCVYNPGSVVGDNSQTADGLAYFAKFVSLFNVGVDEFAMKWGEWESPKKHALAIAAHQRVVDSGIKVRGHCLVWPAWRHLPPDLESLKDNPEKLRARIDDHIRDEVKTFAGKVTEWDVINEPYVNHDLLDILGYDEMAHWLKVAHEADPTVPLLLNETSVPTAPPADQHYDVLYDQVKAIQKRGGPIGGVGMQAHFGSQLTSPTDLMKIYDRFATLNVPLEITEFDVSVTDRQLAADYLRDFFTITFSHPNTRGIMMWGFVANHHWKPDAALFNEDYTLRPAGEAWIDLVKKQWWTNATLTTSADGQCEVRGFLGDYTITATDNGRSITTTLSLSHDGKTLDLVLK